VVRLAGVMRNGSRRWASAGSTDELEKKSRLTVGNWAPRVKGI
jgi:hypothetical protein